MGYDPFGKLRVSEDLGADAVVLPVLVTQIQFRVRACYQPNGVEQRFLSPGTLPSYDFHVLIQSQLV
jgi:hypothetical protein